MKPPPFEYVVGREISEVTSILGQRQGDAKVLAGGQSLVPLLNFRLAAPKLLLDINRVDGLNGINRQGDNLVIGAVVRHDRLEADGLINQAAPLLSLAASHIGHPQIRTRGTLGGSLAHGDASAELPGALVALDGKVVARSDRGRRVIDARDLFTFHLSTCLEEDELVTEIVVPLRKHRGASAFREVAPRRGDFAMAGAAVVLQADGGTLVDARIVCVAVGPTPIRVREAEEQVRGRALDEIIGREVQSAVATTVSPSGDIRASAAYKRRTVSVLVRRGVAEAVEKLGGHIR